MAEALCLLRSIPAPATSFSYARRYYRHRCCSSISRSPSSALLLHQATHAGGSCGSPSTSQDRKHTPCHGLSPHFLVRAASFPGILLRHRRPPPPHPHPHHHNRHRHDAVCSKKKAFHGRECLRMHIAPLYRPPTSLRRSCGGVGDVMLAGCLSSSPPPPSSTLDPSRISGSPFTTSMHSGCGAASTIPTYDEENRMEKGVDRILEPPILKRGMEVPQKWNIPGGTVVLMDKPKGWTSFTVCAKIRKLVQVKKVGHAGTLDPMATGLLVVCVGPATKLADSFQALVKVYTGIFRLGEATSSCDADSPVIETKAWEHISDTDIQIVKEKFVGEIMQIPPMFSAIKVEGERLYEKARRGEQIDVPARKITIYDFQIERNKEDRQLLDFYVRCSKGTYIRSLCADVGRALDSCAHLTKLRREKIGDFSVDDAWQFQDLAEMYSTLYSA